VNQGLIQGRTSFVYRRKDNPSHFVSKGQITNDNSVVPIRVDVAVVANDVLDIEAFKQLRPEYATAQFTLEPDGNYVCGWEVEKMSKSFYNVVTPDDVCAQYGADVFRMYEMFLGPLEQSKPWSTQGITGVQGFLNKAAGLFWDEEGKPIVTDEAPADDALKQVHRLTRKVEEDIEKLSFNTSVPAFMICVNELTKLKCHSRVVLRQLVQTLAPFAPHFAEEAWQKALDEPDSVFRAPWPQVEEKWLVDDEVTYPVQLNGKLKLNLKFPAGLDAATLQAQALAHAEVQALLAGQTPKKVVAVPGRILNLVV
jgi:leucyl-tRNA synthetase